MIEGLQLLLVGMATVFAFLGLLVLTMHAGARIVDALAERLGLDDDVEPEALDSPAPGGRDVELAVAIAAAEAFRRQRGA